MIGDKKIKQMGQESNIGNQRLSNPSSIKSLEMPSWSSASNKNSSIFSNMSVENSRHSRNSIDFYEKMIAESLKNGSSGQGYRLTGGERESLKTFFNFNMQIQPNTIIIQQNIPQVQIVHVCICLSHCKKDQCPCSQCPQQCKKEYCCVECISSKRIGISSQIKQETISAQSQPWCTCKKSKCNKKYCTCYSAGIQCGEFCSCGDCQNRNKPLGMMQEQQQIYVDQYNDLEMPEEIQFEPFQFRYSYQQQ